MRKLKAFLKRDWELALTYPVSLLYQIGQTLAHFLSFFFIGKLLGGGEIPMALAPYGGDYFRFVLVGMTFSLIMTTALHSIGQTLNFERSHGTLEAILLTPTSFTALALSKACWDFGVVVMTSILYLAAGVVLFGVRLTGTHWVPAAAAMALTTVIFLGFGMIASGLTLVFRDSSPLEAAVGWASRFFAGVYFPVAVLPAPLKKLALWLPFTAALDTARKSLIVGTPGSMLKGDLWKLLAYSAVFLPAGFIFFRWAFQRARRLGHLGLS